MKKKAFTHESIPNGMQNQKDCKLQVLKGKVLLNKEEGYLLIIPPIPRGPRSYEILRTRHSRLVQTPQGTFTLTFRFSPDEKNLRSSLKSEMKSIANNVLITGKEVNDEI